MTRQLGLVLTAAALLQAVSFVAVAAAQEAPAAPVFDPPAGLYKTAQDITITSATPGAAIYYTPNGSVPTASSAVYSTPVHIASTTTLKAIAVYSDVESGVTEGLYKIDSQGPVVSAISTLPTTVEQGVTTSITLMATANDSSRGNSRIVAAEYFLGVLGSPGAGAPMLPADGSFDTSVELIQATIDTTGWVQSTLIYLRAMDEAGNWGSIVNRYVTVSESIPPAAITDLAAVSVGDIERLDATVSAYSGAYPGAGVTRLLDNKADTSWQTAGSVLPDDEFVTLDVLSVLPLGAVVLVPYGPGALFPQTCRISVSVDGATWSVVARQRSIKINRAAFLYQFDKVNARYLKMSGPGVLSPKDHRHYWQIAEVSVYRAGSALLQLTWTAPADDGSMGQPASEYDVRVSSAALTAGNFDEATHAYGLGSPKPPGTADNGFVRIDAPSSDSMFLAMKTGDELPNWSEISNVVKLDIHATGLNPLAPANAAAAVADAPPSFQFRLSPDAVPAYICFSTSPEFVTRPTAGPDGRVDRSLKFTLPRGAVSWQPAPSQWKSIKSLTDSNGALYWRLEGVLGIYIGVFGPPRSVLFDVGDFSCDAVSPSHPVDADEAVWPDPAVPPSFAWTNTNPQFKYFFVDISTDSTFASGNGKNTVTLGGSGTMLSPYPASKSEWKKVRQLASAADGVLFWRMRAQDADKALTAACTGKNLLVDGGQWTLDPLDLADPEPQVSWTNSATGIARFYLQFSVGDDFAPGSRRTTRLSTVPAPSHTYLLKSADVTRLQALAKRSAVTTLYYRVCGEDADRAFVCHSDALTVSVP